MILETLIQQKRFFDVSNKKDIEQVRNFFKTMAWGKDGCPFICEYPYLSVPDMVKDKLLHKALSIPYDRTARTF